MRLARVPAVKVGHQRQRGVGDLRLPGQLGFGHVGHADHAAAQAAVPIRFGQTGKLRAFDAHIGAAFVQRHAVAGRFTRQHIAHRLRQHASGGQANRLRHRHMGDRALAKKRAVTAFGQVDELVGQHHVERLEIFLQGTHGGHRQQVAHAELLHGVDVGAVGHFMRQQAVAARMPGQENHRHALHATRDQHVRRRAKRRLDDLLLRAFERVHLVKATASDDADQCLVHA